MIYEQILNVSIYQWLTTLFSLLYIFFAVRNNGICFVFGLISSLIWAYEDFQFLNLKFDGILQLFYAVMSIAGIINWRKNTQSKTGIKSLEVKTQVFIIISGIIISLILGYFASKYWNTNLPFLDSMTTGFSIIATFLLIGRYVDNWIYWIVVDIVYVYIFFQSGGYLFVFIMVIFTFMAFQGYFLWKREMLNQRMNI